MLQYLIAKIESGIVHEGCKDRAVWLGDLSNCYSVKSAYKLLAEASNSGDQLPYKKA
jgi:hypothetical protein